MSYKFKIEYVSSNERTAILARQLQQAAFQLSANPQLGGYKIEPSISQPRKIKQNGDLDLDIFYFYLKKSNDSVNFNIGEIVELKP